MLGTRIPHPKSTKFDEDDENSSPRPLKRLKREETRDTSDAESPPASPSLRYDDGTLMSSEGDVDIPRSSQTNLEAALPPTKTDQDAIDEYEAYKAAETEEFEGAKQRLSNQKWVKGRSSIYVDAFNLALETVLEDERHLFDEAELALFDVWRDLSYEAQYL